MTAKNIYQEIFRVKNTDHLQLEREANLGEKTVYRALNRNTGSLSADTAKKIHTLYPDISLQWLLTGEGDMFTNPTDKPDTNTKSPEPPDYFRTIIEQQAAILTMLAHGQVDIRETAREAKDMAINALAGYQELKTTVDGDHGTLEDVKARLGGLQEVILKKIAALVNKQDLPPTSPEELASASHIASKKFRKEQKTGTQTNEGKKSSVKEKVGT
jgi:hypothetical protein